MFHICQPNFIMFAMFSTTTFGSASDIFSRNKNVQVALQETAELFSKLSYGFFVLALRGEISPKDSAHIKLPGKILIDGTIMASW
jgi:hypothetical protein